MMSIINTFLDLLFPPRESERTVRTLSPSDIHATKVRGTHGGIMYLSRYQNPLIHALITENKFHHNPKASRLLAILLTEQSSSLHTVYIPIPLHKKRERERGYNQVTEVIKRTSFRRDENILTRTIYTAPQTTLNKQHRMQNMSDVFSVDSARMQTYTDTHFILLDDVVTTGATLKAAQASLAPHLHPTSTLSCLALAH